MENKIIELDETQPITTNKSIITLNVYIVHCSDFKQRKELMEENKNIFNKLNFTINWQYVEKYSLNHLKENIKEITKDIKLEDTEFEDFNELRENLHLAHLSNIYNHLECLNKIKEDYSKLTEQEKQNKNHFYLILEDDVFLMNIFVDKMNELINKLNTNKIHYDLIFLGIPLTINNKSEDKKKNDIEISNESILNFIPQYLKFLPSCDSYLINPTLLENGDIYNEFNKIKFAYNYQLSYIMRKFNLKSYFITSHIALDGSKMGIIPSSININNVHIYCNEFMNMIQILNIPEEEFNKDIDKYEKEFNDNYEKVKEFDNPDILHLNAIFHNKMKKYETALKIFQHAHNRYQYIPNNISNESNFIIDYVKTYERLQ